MTVGELNQRMSLGEYFGWQQYDQHLAERAERAKEDAEAVEAGEPTYDMREEALAEARARGLEIEEADGNHG